MRDWYWIQDESGEYIRVFPEELDEDLLERLKSRPAIGGFCYPADDFLSLPLTTAPFYVAQGWLPKQGKTLIYAPAKSGKSYLAIQLARCIGAGEPFLGIPTTQGRVLYLQFELGIEILQERMRGTRSSYSDVYVGTNFSMKIDRPDGQKQLRQAMESVKPQVLILDPMYKIISGDENLAQDIEKVTDFLDSIIEEFQCSILIIDHTGYDKTHARGSTVKEGWVDGYISVRKISKNGEPLRIAVAPQLLRHAELPPSPVIAMLDSNYEFKAVVEEDEPSTRDKVAQTLRQSPESITAKRLIELCGSRNAVYDALEKLIASGDVEKLDRGIYRWKERK